MQGRSLHPRANSVFLSLSPPLFLPFNPHVHPVNYFVSGYLQRAVNSCRADYTDRFIALVSQSNVCNAPIPTTHSPTLMLFLSSFALFGIFTSLSLVATEPLLISLTSRTSTLVFQITRCSLVQVSLEVMISHLRIFNSLGSLFVWKKMYFNKLAHA